MTEKTNANPRFKKSRQARVREDSQAKQGAAGFSRLAGASSLLNAVTSENTRQAMRLRNSGDAWSVVTVNEEVYRYPSSYGTGKFRAIGSLSESAIVDFYGTGDLQPEKRLMLTVLQGAVECFKEYAEHDRLFKDAEEWIFEDDHEWPFSFINICEAVDMNPKYLRKGLLHWRQRPAIVPYKGSDRRCA